MVSPVFIAALITILPGMGILWMYLKRYEGMFDDAKVFFGLTAGFFAGLVSAALEFLLFPFADPVFQAAVGVLSAAMYFIVGYAFFETGIKVMVLGLGRFKGRKDTPYYGAAFGIGMGAMASLLVLARGAAPFLDDSGLSAGALAVTIVGLALAPVGAMFTHGATGAIVGHFSAQRKLWKGWGFGTLMQLPVLLGYWLFIKGALPTAVIGLVVLGYGSLCLWWTQSRILDRVVPKELKDQLRRAQRREAMAAARGEGKDEEE